MKLSIPVLVAALTVTVTPLAAQSDLDAKDWKNREITMRGCVQDGVEKGHYVLRNFAEVPAAGASAMPKFAHGRRVIFWLEDLPKLNKHLNRMVEVKGTFVDITESETDPKTRDGRMIIEFEGPGRDVDLTAAQAREVVGTSGTEKTLILLVRVNVDDVKEVAGSCN
jgi:hypothetical protein